VTSFYEQDGLGSITSLSSSTGTLANSYSYDTYGNLTSSSGSIGNPLQYTGRDFDPETGLRYYRARYYDPQIGRFISEDPLRYTGGGNTFYSYVANGPHNYRDPSGLKLAPQVPLTPQGGLDYADYLAAIEYLERDPVGAQLLAFLEASQTVFTIVFIHDGDTYFDDKTNTLYWDPRLGVRVCRGGGMQTPALVLFHELAHAKRGKRKKALDPQYDNSEERVVIQDFETPFAIRNGQPVRVDHGSPTGSSGWTTIGSTSSIPTPTMPVGTPGPPTIPLPEK
jgi:RHS repeat-associated protein